MTDLTPEQLDKARAEEALRLFHSASRTPSPPVAEIAARLAREGWTPNPPVDPEVLAARELRAQMWEKKDSPLDGHLEAQAWREGMRDETDSMEMLVAAYRAGRLATEERYGGVVKAGVGMSSLIQRNDTLTRNYAAPYAKAFDAALSALESGR